MLAQLKQENLMDLTSPGAGTTSGGGGGGGAASAAQAAAASKAAQDEIRALSMQLMQDTKLATLESMKASHASQMTSMFIGMMTETESQLLKTAQAYLQLAGQAHALINAGIQ